MATLPIDRGPRLAGRSRMNYVSLVIHGLSAFSVFSEIVATRILIGGSIAFVLVSAVFFGLLGLHSFHRLELGNWTIATLVLVFVVISSAVITAVFSAFGVLARRDQLGFLPIRDAGYFIGSRYSVFHDGAETR